MLARHYLHNNPLCTTSDVHMSSVCKPYFTQQIQTDYNLIIDKQVFWFNHFDLVAITKAYNFSRTNIPE